MLGLTIFDFFDGVILMMLDVLRSVTLLLVLGVAAVGALSRSRSRLLSLGFFPFFDKVPEVLRFTKFLVLTYG